MGAALLESVDFLRYSEASDKSIVGVSRPSGLRELYILHWKLVSTRAARILAVRCPRLEILDMELISGVRDSLLIVVRQNCPCVTVLKMSDALNVSSEGITHTEQGYPHLGASKCFIEEAIGL